jgi:hypothetical protein
MYMEDVVLGQRLKDAGGRIVEFQARLVHREGQGSAIGSRERRRLLNRARCRYALSSGRVWLSMVMAAVALPAEIIQGLRRGLR